MKVGIVSQFGYENMGNKLQNYAVQQILSDYADSAITLKNNPRAKNPLQWLRWFTPLADSGFVYRITGRKRKAEILRFHRSYINDSAKYYCLNDAQQRLSPKDRCDFYCAGSDQVWKPGSGRVGPLQFLAFADREQTFAFSASFGVDEVPQQYKAELSKRLQHIKHISVREDAGKKIVEELTGRTDAVVVADPTMLLTTQQWDQILRKPKVQLPEKYILVYFLGPISSERRAFIRKKAAQMGCKVVAVMDQNSPYFNIGPDEFLYLIKNAELVCTDSFHGSVFSFLYQRKLAIFDRQGKGNNMSSRIDTLASKFCLESCRVRDNDMPEDITDADYSHGYQVLEQERQKAKQFLDKVFHKE